jgi:hypothetical protein
VEALQAIDLYFKQRPDAVGKICFSGLNKICVTLQTIAYEYSADKADQYFRMAESTVLETVDHFERGLITTFGGSHLRVPASEDVRRMLAASLKIGWPGKSNSLDFMSLCCKKYPYSLTKAER